MLIFSISRRGTPRATSTVFVPDCFVTWMADAGDGRRCAAPKRLCFRRVDNVHDVPFM